MQKKWSALLMKGYKIIAFAGNDAHGYFNCKREVHIPFVSLSSSRDQIFGQCKTYIKSDKGKLSPDNFFDELSKNRIMLSDGIFGSFTVNGQDIGSIIKEEDEYKCVIEVASSVEFGTIRSINLLSGYYNNFKETVEFQHTPEDEFSISKIVTIHNTGQNYFRLEATSDNNSFCLTNPIWMKKNDVLTEKLE